MGIVDKTSKSDDSVAGRLPKEVAFAPDICVTIERNGDVLTIRPLADPTEERRKLMELLADLAAIGRPDDCVQPRPKFEAPERPNL